MTASRSADHQGSGREVRQDGLFDVPGYQFGCPSERDRSTRRTDRTSEPVSERPTATQDVELVASVVRLALDPGYRVVERSGRVFRVEPSDSNDRVQEVPRYEADTVTQLLDTKLLELGGNHTITYRDHTGPARSVLVPKDTRSRVTRWANLRPLPIRRPAPDRPTTDTDGGGSGGGEQRGWGREPVSGPITVVVTAPGTGQVQCAQFHGEITREVGRYLVTTERGHRVARTSSYHLGARRLARHHGYRPGPVEIQHPQEGNR